MIKKLKSLTSLQYIGLSVIAILLITAIVLSIFKITYHGNRKVVELQPLKEESGSVLGSNSPDPNQPPADTNSNPVSIVPDLHRDVALVTKTDSPPPVSATPEPANPVPDNTPIIPPDDRNEQVVISDSGGYPYANWPPDVPDSYGYLTRESTSYVAWWRAVHGKPVGMWGNSGNWPGSYIAPAYGDVAVFGPGVGGAFGVGHVAIVESVNGNGTINLSEYNWVPYNFSRRNGVSTSGVRFIN